MMMMIMTHICRSLFDSIYAGIPQCVQVEVVFTLFLILNVLFDFLHCVDNRCYEKPLEWTLYNCEQYKCSKPSETQSQAFEEFQVTSILFERCWCQRREMVYHAFVSVVVFISGKYRQPTAFMYMQDGSISLFVSSRLWFYMLYFSIDLVLCSQKF